jgi:Protein of unknown function (DUF4230)
MIKNILLGVLLFAAGIWITHKYYTATTSQSSEQAQVLLERIKSVTKLITVEGYFSEVFEHTDYWGYDFSPFRKKALIRVKAKVSVGYDLTPMLVNADSKTKTITISNVPSDPTILSLDHNLDYYDLTEGTFNSFTAKDYTELNEKAKNFVRNRAEESQLKEAARKQGHEMLDAIRFMVESTGWTLVINGGNWKG